MRKSEIDDLLGVMLESYDNVSDLNVTCERPLQVEAAGELVPVPVEPSIENLTPFQTEIFALNLINNDRRLTEHLLRQGSCDSSYALPARRASASTSSRSAVTSRSCSGNSRRASRPSKT